ncbi:MAG TPA: VOC family protein [Candidatus Methylacidiphilales bacterium]|nr:VOC family protein [Candidatus Methylacidiphilales bacterium]
MNAFTHIAINCHDKFAQERFYTKHLGFKRCRTFNRGQPNEFFLLRLGSMRLELFTGGKATVNDKGGEQAIGFKHLAFEVPKLEPVLDALLADGVDCDKIIEVPHLAPGARILFFRDPEGNIIELMENYRDEE